jgi:hypothetical protein
VSFSSASRELVTPPPTNSQLNVYVRDVLHATTVRASITAGGTSPKGFSINSHLSDDGLSVVFTSDAKSLVATDQDSFEDTYLRNLVTGTTYRLSTTATGAPLNAHSRSPSASPDNQFVAWATPTRLLAGNTAGQLEIVVRDLGTGWMGAPVASR